MKTGLFGGGFNPVHNGHINLAKYFLQYLQLDRIIFIPTAMPPHKTSTDFVSEQHRINMLNLATQDLQNVQISNIEFTFTEKSYTYNTLCALKNMYPDDEFYLIIGSDQFFNFKSWYKYGELLQMATICTSARLVTELEKLVQFATQDSEISKSSYVIAPCPVIEVSSSQVRQMLKDNQDVSHLVPSSVNKYIKDNQLYV